MSSRTYTEQELKSALTTEREAIVAEVEKLKSNIPPYPMEGPSADMITWAARYGHFKALDEIIRVVKARV